MSRRGLSLSRRVGRLRHAAVEDDVSTKGARFGRSALLRSLRGSTTHCVDDRGS